MVKRKKVEYPIPPTPQNLDEAASFLSQLWHEQREIDKIKAVRDKKISDLQTRISEKLKPHEEKINQLAEGIFIFAEKSREEITDGGKHKTVELPTGFFAWRITPPSVSISNIKLVIARLEDLELERFLRTKKEPDKETMLKEEEVAKTVKGISINRHEEFIIKPVKMETKLTFRVKKLKKKLKKAFS